MTGLYPNRHNLFAWLQAMVMLAGLIFLKWDPLFVVMAYFFETIIIGVIHMVKMAVVLLYGTAQNRKK